MNLAYTLHANSKFDNALRLGARVPILDNFEAERCVGLAMRRGESGQANSVAHSAANSRYYRLIDLVTVMLQLLTKSVPTVQ